MQQIDISLRLLGILNRFRAVEKMSAQSTAKTFVVGQLRMSHATIAQIKAATRPGPLTHFLPLAMRKVEDFTDQDGQHGCLVRTGHAHVLLVLAMSTLHRAHHRGDEIRVASNIQSSH